MEDKFTDFLIPMTFPNWRIYMPDKWFRSILHAFGYNKDNSTALGHSLILMIESSTGKVEYTDFGRYCIPKGYSRARLAKDDVLLFVPIKAKIENGLVLNVQELMEWVFSEHHIHLSGGPLFYKVLPNCNFKKGLDFAKKMVSKGIIEYDIFGKSKSNCSRYVRDLMLESMEPLKIDFGFKHAIISPTPIDNVFYNFRKLGYWKLEDGVHTHFKHKFLDFIRFYNGKRIISKQKKKVYPDFPDKHFVSCTGVGAYFSYTIINETNLTLKKYNTEVTFEWEKEFLVTQGAFNPKKPIRFGYSYALYEFEVFQDNKKVAIIQSVDTI